MDLEKKSQETMIEMQKIQSDIHQLQGKVGQLNSRFFELKGQLEFIEELQSEGNDNG